jgi:hypothetical protein
MLLELNFPDSISQLKVKFQMFVKLKHGRGGPIGLDLKCLKKLTYPLKRLMNTSSLADLQGGNFGAKIWLFLCLFYESQLCYTCLNQKTREVTGGRC